MLHIMQAMLRVNNMQNMFWIHVMKQKLHIPSSHSQTWQTGYSQEYADSISEAQTMGVKIVIDVISKN